MQNETIQSLQRVIVNKNTQLQGCYETIERLADTIESMKAGQTRLMMRTDRFKREMAAVKREMEHMAQAILDIAAKQPRIEREVSRFEKLNNANEWVKP